MLILTRKAGEIINIGDDIEITVLGISGQQVRIGMTAPKDLSVHRNEIYQRIQAGTPKPERLETRQDERLTRDIDTGTRDPDRDWRYHQHLDPSLMETFR